MHTPQTATNHSSATARILSGCGLCCALLLLAAHYYRAGEYGVALSTGGVLLFLCRNVPWQRFAVAFFLLWGALEWGGTAYFLAKTRASFGLPWLRAAAIVLGMALVTGLAGLHALRNAQRTLAASPRPHALLQALTFMGTFLALFYLRQASPLPFLLLERYLPLWGSVEIFLAAWYAAFIAGKLADPRQSRKARRLAWTLFCGVFFAQFFLGALGLTHMLLTGTLHAPIPAFILFAPVFRASFSMMPVILTLAVLLSGSAWCGLFCYFGPLDSLAAGTGAARPAPPALRTALRHGRLAVLLTGCAVAAMLRKAGADTAAALSLTLLFALASLAFMAFVSRRYRVMAHCTGFCPIGLAVNALGRLSPWRMRVDSAKCDNCRACEAVCKYAAITRESRAAGKTLFTCSLCRDCAAVCKPGAVALACPGLSREKAASLFVGLVSGLHALFLAVAMV